MTAFFLLTGGSRSRRLTSEGSDKSAEPTRDARGDELEKSRDVEEDIAGTRKSGNEAIGLCDTLKRCARLLVTAMSVPLYFDNGAFREVKSTPSPAKPSALAKLRLTRFPNDPIFPLS